MNEKRELTFGDMVNFFEPIIYEQAGTISKNLLDLNDKMKEYCQANNLPLPEEIHTFDSKDQTDLYYDIVRVLTDFYKMPFEVTATEEELKELGKLIIKNFGP
ncbi:MAG: hypothetical protein V1867_02750 [Candidatus Falkowbacteria bacterium]